VSKEALANKISLLTQMGLSIKDINLFVARSALGRDLSGFQYLLIAACRSTLSQEDQDALEDAVDAYLFMIADLSSEVGFG